MKNKVSKLSMQKRMMIYFSVPLLAIQIIITAFSYPVLMKKFRSQIDYSLAQSINQAVSFLESYIQNMKYLADMVESNGEIYGVLSSKKLPEEKSLSEQYTEYYLLRKTFDSLEISNSLYRFGLYLSNDSVYINNNYYIFPYTRLEGREDYDRMEEYFSMGKDYLALSEERENIGGGGWKQRKC